MTENQTTAPASPDPLASSRERDAQLAELKAEAVQVAAAAPETGTPREVTAHERATIERIVALGCHLMPLKPGAKNPAREKWQIAPAMTVDEAVAHVAAGGNLGIHLGFSGLIALDAENLAASQAVMGIGLRLTVAPAKSRVAGHPKEHGSHTWLRVPEGIDPTSLTSHGMQVTLPGGGLIDVLAGGKQAVVPPSTLTEVQGAAYSAYAGSPLDLDVPLDQAVIATAPLWLFDATLDCPEGLTPLRGCLAPKVRHDLAELDARSIELTEQIDQVPWAEWIAADPRLSPAGQVDGCGCEIWHWVGSDHDKSATLHEDCAQGSGAHIWSGTMMAALGIGEHVSRLDLAVALRGESRSTVAASVGIRLGREQELTAIDPDHLDEAADEAEAEGDAATAAELRSAAEVMRSRQHAVAPKEGAVLVGANSVVGAPAPVTISVSAAGKVAPVIPIFGPRTPAPEGLEPAPSFGTISAGSAPPTAGANALAPAPASSLLVAPEEDEDADEVEDEVEPVVEPDMTLHTFTGTPPRKGQIMQYPVPEVPAHVEPVEGAVTEWRDVLPPIANARTHAYVPHEWIFYATPGLSQVAAAADARGVNRWGLLGALLPRIAAKIPATVRLTPAEGEVPESNAPTALGASLNMYSAGVAPPARGKTSTMTVASALIPGVHTLPPGTGEGVLKEFPRTSELDDSGDGDRDGDGVPEISNGVSGDIESRMLESDEIDVFVGEMNRTGSKTSGWYRSMWMGGEVGNTASESERRSLIAAHTYRFGILLGAQPEALAPLFGEAGRGTPQRFMWLPAQKAIARGRYPERLQVAEVQWLGTDPSMIPQLPGQRPPVWIYPPKAAKAAMDRDAWLAAAADPLTMPAVTDRAEAIADLHAVLQQRKVATLIAALDGLTQPQDVHWYAAGAVMEVRRRVIHQLVAESDRIKAEGKQVEGHYTGIAHAAANDARDAARQANVARCAATIIRALIKDAAQGLPPRTHAKAKKALSSTARAGGGLSDYQMYGDAALAVVLRDETVANLGTRVQYVGKASAA
ncbi:bifunctional DNA primase/polymerase [Mycobacteroides abscessus]|uniref:bifunctional DNA primase/polymerase n=1 Tax=Mycobacteroides abscessus TaxID=36809 RepID=UPI000C25B6DB|nr:bifunctional DNA primase/polymerase [Mycobacteroides abscessus]